ncbi:MAG: hypothetical protein SV760_09400 [Halobacteria archaeon]|nr:hypothetical protein [Halobacteria archaeon]
MEFELTKQRKVQMAVALVVGIVVGAGVGTVIGSTVLSGTAAVTQPGDGDQPPSPDRILTLNQSYDGETVTVQKGTVVVITLKSSQKEDGWKVTRKKGIEVVRNRYVSSGKDGSGEWITRLKVKKKGMLRMEQNSTGKTFDLNFEIGEIKPL